MKAEVYAKFREKYGVMSNFAEHIELSVSFTKFMELCQNYGNMLSFGKNFVQLHKVWEHIFFSKGIIVIFIE